MERRSRSTTRNRQAAVELSASLNRNSTTGRSFPEIPTNSSLLQRVGGDSRTLSPERKPPHNYGFPKTSPHHSMSKSGSYNVYTHGQPPPIPPAPHGGLLSHAASAIALGVNGTSVGDPRGNPGQNPVPPPRAPVSNPPSNNQNNKNNNNIKQVGWAHFFYSLHLLSLFSMGPSIRDVGMFFSTPPYPMSAVLCYSLLAHTA